MTHDLEAVQRKIIDLYESERYQEALGLSRSVQEAYPANASYWSACLLSLMGEREQSLTTLERALEAGCWWSPLALRRDPDLEPLRGDDRFTRVVDASEEKWRASFRDEPELLMFPPSEKDWARDRCLALAEQARVVGLPWHIEAVPGIGHKIPDDFPSRSRRAMDFLLSTPHDDGARRRP